MKVFIKNAIIKKILVVFITIIMVSNFIMPNYVCAASAPEKLVAGFFYLLSYVGDAAISLMQQIMVGTDDITDAGEYRIKYSPGMIFADEVPALKVNFVTASESDNKLKDLTSSPDNENELKEILKRLNLKEEAGVSFKEHIGTIRRVDDNIFLDNLTDGVSNGINITDMGVNWAINTYNSKQFYYPTSFQSVVISTMDVFPEGWTGLWDNDVDALLDKKIHKNLDYPETETGKLAAYMIWYFDGYIYIASCRLIDYLDSDNYWVIGGYDSFYLTEGSVINRYNVTALVADELEDEGSTLESTAYKLKNNIATWYTALRTIATVGLLSVLVYLGIRIILSSSSAQDKAKYKNMLKDWLVALCILFVLHYIMAFMLNFTEKVSEIIKGNVTAQNSNGNNYDELMSTVRNEYDASKDEEDEPIPKTAGYTVMYLALVILTGVFTFQYLKRVIFMAFLTMIAPMIALTYPIDKVKDGKAQAFSYWLKEYIFNCLIQPVHLLIYTILITNAIDFAKENILYAIVALGFMVPAEKFIKDMFGMKTDSPTGQLGAAAGGAMIMSMLNKIKGKPPKDDAGSGGAGNANNVRTANNRTATSGSSGDPGSGSPSSGSPGSGSPSSGSPSSTSPSSGSPSSGSPSSGSPRPGVGKGIRRAGKNLAIKGFDGIKSAGIGVLKKAPGAVLGATVGLAATVASGGENAMAFIGGGAAAGSALTSNIAGGIGKFGKDTYAEYQKGKYGQEAYQNRKFDKEFYKSDGYRLIEEDSSIQSLASSKTLSVKELTQTYLDAGITDASKIREALQNDITGTEYAAYSKAGIESPKKIANIKKNYTAEQAASRMALAKNAPKTLGDFKAMMVGRKFDGKTVTDADAERIYKELVDFF